MTSGAFFFERARFLCEGPNPQAWGSEHGSAGPRKSRVRKPSQRLLGRRLLSAAWSALLLLLSKTGQAGNLDSFYVSGEAALQGGAVTATSSGGGSIWYNPAGLSALNGTRLDVNVSGYALRFGANVGFDSTLPGAQETRLTLLELDVVPAAVALTRRFGAVGVGLGVFVPSQSSLNLRTLIEAPSSDGSGELTFGYDSHSRVQEYHLGPGIGWDPTDALSLGGSLLVNYRTISESSDVAARLSGGRLGEVGWSRHERLDSIALGLELVLGTQWRFAPGYSLGMVLRTPSLRLGQAAERIETELVTDASGEIDQNIDFEEALFITTQILNPFRFHLGLSRQLGDWSVSAETSLLLPFENQILDNTDRATFNLRAGAVKRLTPRWSVGGGIFSDRSPAPEPQDFLDKQIDFYGATLAVDWNTPYGVYAKGGRVLDAPKQLAFGTTLALSYALGLGTIAGALVGPGSEGEIRVSSNPAAVVAHEISLHIATTLSE